MKRKAPMPVLGLSASSRLPCKRRGGQGCHRRPRAARPVPAAPAIPALTQPPALAEPLSAAGHGTWQPVGATRGSRSAAGAVARREEKVELRQDAGWGAGGQRSEVLVLGNHQKTRAASRCSCRRELRAPRAAGCARPPVPAARRLTLKEASASATLFSMNSSVMRREGCSLKTEFISAILAALRRASALVGQNWGETNRPQDGGTDASPLAPPRRGVGLEGDRGRPETGGI